MSEKQSEYNSNSYHKKHQFYIIRSNCRPQSAQPQSKNIFQGKRQKLVDDKEPVKSSHIVGGMQTFLKQQKKRQSKLKYNKSGKHHQFISQKRVIPKSQIFQSQQLHTGETRQQKQKQKGNFFKEHDVNAIQQNLKKQQFNEQNFKIHQDFRPKTAASISEYHNICVKSTNKNYHSHSSTVLSTSKTNQKSMEWADSQIQNYNNKSAMLAQITYTQPLHQKYGDRYFQFCLRDRYKEDFPLPSYIYQIRSNIKVTKFTKTLKKFRPEIGIKNKLVLKGRHTSLSQIKQ